MKLLKTLLLLLVFTFSISLNAQKPEKKAEKFADKVSKAIKLSKKEYKEVYEIQLARFKDGKEIRQKYKDDEATRKAELKKLGNRVYNQMKKTLGKERLKKWNNYRKSNKNK